MTYDFNGLTVLQQQLLTHGGWNDAIGHRIRYRPFPEQVKPLIDRGLLTAREVKRKFWTQMEYEVPADVQAAWNARRALQAKGPR
jgi:hypothetical protein